MTIEERFWDVRSAVRCVESQWGRLGMSAGERFDLISILSTFDPAVMRARWNGVRAIDL